MSEWNWEDAIGELEATAKCRCEPCWTDRGMHAPECQSDLATVIEYLREYERQNVLYREIVVGEGTWQRFQALQARAEAAEQRVRELQRDCGEAYQVVGHMLGIDEFAIAFTDDDVELALDNLSAACEGRPRPHDDLLPWPKRLTGSGSAG